MMRRWKRILLLTLAAAALGCGTAPVRFVEGPVVTQIDDRRDIPEPAEAEFHRFAHHIENFVDRQIRLRTDPVPSAPALDVNRRGEVPSSSWYTFRGPLTPEEVALGAGSDDLEGPMAHRPWTITRVKAGGANPGFIFEDSRGVGYLLKVDKRGVPTVATAAGAVANRLFWALGYHVPDDRIVEFAREEMVLGEKARRGGVDEATVDFVLNGFATRLEDGRYRALVSRFLPGKPRGGFDYTGRREDDPNDTIDHERRRSLRALRVFGAWLNHVDMKVDNTLDLYTERDGRHFLEHYLVDFDGCLGGYWAARHEERIGWAYDLDLGELVSGLPLLGLKPRVYERSEPPVHPEIGLFEADLYDPARWKANYLNDQVLSARPADLYWAGTVLSRLRRPHLESATRAARFRDPAAESLLAEILWRRWEKTVRWALLQVTPVTQLEPRGSAPQLQIDAVDALRESGLDSDLVYEIVVSDGEGHQLERVVEQGSSPAMSFSAPPGLDTLVVSWRARHPEGPPLPPSEAHYRRGPEGWKLLGILRDGE